MGLKVDYSDMFGYGIQITMVLEIQDKITTFLSGLLLLKPVQNCFRMGVLFPNAQIEVEVPSHVHHFYLHRCHQDIQEAEGVENQICEKNFTLI